MVFYECVITAKNTTRESIYDGVLFCFRSITQSVCQQIIKTNLTHLRDFLQIFTLYRI